MRSIKYVGPFSAFRHAQITATLACGERTQSIVTVLPKYTKIVSAVAIPFQVGVEMAVTFVQFVRPESSFDPELVATLIAAYDEAVAFLHDNGQPQVVREIMARRIIEAAKKGERDPDRLRNAALIALQGIGRPQRLEPLCRRRPSSGPDYR